MNVVIDTNVMVSGIFWAGIPLKIIRYWMNDQIQAVASEDILDEYLKTIEKTSNLTGRNDLYDYWRFVIPKKAQLIRVQKMFHLCRDTSDNKFIDCAIAAKAKYLISGDQDLLVLKNVMYVQIITPKHFLEVF